MKSQYISDLRDGSEVSSSFWVKFMAVPLAKSGKPYINIELMDKTGTITGRIWDNIESNKRLFSQGDYVHIEGSALLYQGSMQIKVASITRLENSEVIPGDYFPVSAKSPVEMTAQLKALMATIEDMWIKKLVFAFLDDDDFMAKFRTAPAAKSMHHAFLHGLLEHTLSVASLCDKISAHYPSLNRDLLLAGAFLHDIGKTDELTYEYGFDYSDEGRLVGHLVMASEWIGQKAAQIDQFPREIENLLKHLVLAHHGRYEYASPKRPKIIEAMALNYIDELDAYMNYWESALNDASENDKWTPYNKLLDRYVLKTKKLDQKETETASNKQAKPRLGSDPFINRPFANLLDISMNPSADKEKEERKKAEEKEKIHLSLFEKGKKEGV